MTLPAPNSLARHLRVPGYLFFGIAMILPLLDLLVSVYPARLGTVVWRFGAVGLLSSAIGAPLLVLFFIFALALFVGDRKVIVTVGVVAALIALLLVAGTGSFALDALQMKRRVQAAAQQRFMMASMQAMMKLILEAISAIVLSITAFRTLKKSKRAASSRPEPRAAGSLMMGRPSAPRPIAAATEAPPAEITTSTEE
ncbi:MAG: hypothetical protein JWL61_559 [Gemmatimonadetes bacterium]|jgi:hypothetical protein|nr:hypothetical protein [Gemmatimonadota bacterium]